MGRNEEDHEVKSKKESGRMPGFCHSNFTFALGQQQVQE
ncbi:hypothetical protein BN1002_04592 [Bacillus sp. B-jedd]|nr:hypothetical protein BN1002_04592 [Bacillus sp. B-jedd]